MSNIKYKTHGVSISIDGQAVVELPPRVFRGRLAGRLFEEDKAFLLPSAIEGMRGMVAFYEEHDGLEALLTAHTDRPGAADRNLLLSSERADVVAAFLQDKVDDWMPFYSASKSSMKWGPREDQHMLSVLRDGEGPFWRGLPNGIDDLVMQTAVKRFQRSKGLGEDGKLSDATRKAIILAYMQQEGTTLPEGTRLKTHGCGEGHPEVATGANVEHLKNRRLELFLFEGSMDPQPRKGCAPGGCAEYKTWMKRTVETVDCREHAPVLLPAFLSLEMVDEQGKPVGNIKYKVTAADGTVKEGMLDDKGKARIDPIPPGLCRVSFPELDSGAWEEA